MKLINKTILIILVLALAIPAIAQRKKNKNQSISMSEMSVNPDLYKGLKFRNIGPFRGGRSVAVSGVRGNPMLYYMGSTGGGLWKTDDAGLSWKNISDGQFKTGSVGAIAVAPSDPNVIYVGMGEHPVRGVMTSFGDGIYKSTDAGKTWNNIGLPLTRHIAAVRVHPENADIVYVAAQGAVHGPTTERGVYKTNDGGKTWNKVLYVNENTGAAGLSMDMTNPRILYAGMWEHRRFPWTVQSGGDGSGIYKSVDGGDTWEELSKGLPKEMGKVAVDVSPANPNRAQQALLTQIDDALLDMHQNVNRMRKVKKQVKTYNKTLKGRVGLEKLMTAGKTVLDNISNWENNLIQPSQKTFQDVINFPNQLNSHFMNLKNKIDSHDPRPTEGVKLRLKELLGEWMTHKATLDKIINEDVKAYNDLYHSLKIPALVIPEEK